MILLRDSSEDVTYELNGQYNCWIELYIDIWKNITNIPNYRLRIHDQNSKIIEHDYIRMLDSVPDEIKTISAIYSRLRGSGPSGHSECRMMYGICLREHGSEYGDHTWYNPANNQYQSNCVPVHARTVDELEKMYLEYKTSQKMLLWYTLSGSLVLQHKTMTVDERR